MRSACPIIINTLCSYCQALITEPDISVISSWVVPPSQEQPPFDLNHMGTGSDKSDALGVPYYNQHAM
ncbi:multiple antibiotic resistance regulatory protein MarB [Escherichia coli]|uniref:multiple antibiotic resistance regulatory protein MarB n=1 Tax=Escherichia coli TaxID=562 RepID=UPI0035B528D7